MEQKQPVIPSITYTFDASKLSNNRRHHPHIQVSPGIPKIANRQIPIHGLGPAFNQRSLLKDKHYRSKVWRVEYERVKKSEEKMNKTFYNRPVHMLRQYLDRKERQSVQSVLVGNPEDEKTEETQERYPQYSKTTNDFRIRKPQRKNLLFETQPPNYQSFDEIQTSRFRSSDQDFATFQSKNLYEMTIEELQESMNWKKQFLHMLTKKMVADKPRGMGYHER